MATFQDLTAAQLRHVIRLKERIEYLQGLLASLRSAAVPASPTKKKVSRPRMVSPGTRVNKVRRAKTCSDDESTAVGQEERRSCIQNF